MTTDIPGAEHAEQAVLGAVLQSRDALAEAREVLIEADFYRPCHQVIFTACVALADRGDPVDQFTVPEELNRRGKLERVGGGTYLHTLIAGVPTTANVGYHADIVARKGKQRRLVEALDRAAQMTRGEISTDEELGKILGQVRDEVDGLDRPPPQVSSSWRPVDLDDVLAGLYAPPVPSVGCRDDGVGLFYPSRVHSVASESEGGKTWLALSSALTELERGNTVVYLDFEDDEGGIVGRLLALAGDHDPISHDPIRKMIRDRFAYLRPTAPITSARNRADLADLLADLNPTLVILDGVTEAMTLHGLELKDNTDVARFAAQLPRWIAERGPAVACLDHVTKNRETRGRYAIGGVHKLNGVDGAAYVLENRVPFGIGTTGRSAVMLTKDRPAQLRKEAIRASEGRHWFADLVVTSDLHDGFPVLSTALERPEPQTGPFRPTTLMARVSEALIRAGEPLTTRDLYARIKARKSAVDAAVAAMVDDDHIAVDRGPRGARLHRLINPYHGET